MAASNLNFHNDFTVWLLQIYLYDGEGKLASIMSVNNTAVTSLLIQQIRANVAYRIQMSAYNSAGEGPRTEMAFVGMYRLKVIL